MMTRLWVNKGKVIAHSAETARYRVWSSVYTSFVKLLSLCTLVPTRMIDEHTLQDSWLRDDYFLLMDSMELGNLPRMKPHLCTTLASEFLATVTLHFEDTHDPKADQGCISFFSTSSCIQWPYFSTMMSLILQIIRRLTFLRLEILWSSRIWLDLVALFRKGRSNLWLGTMSIVLRCKSEATVEEDVSFGCYT